MTYVDHGSRHGASGTDAAPPGQWQYATPIAPATTPDDYVSGAAGNAAFKNGAVNTMLPDGTYSPLRWRHVTKGRVEIVGAVDGAAIGSAIVTLPAVFRPSADVVASIASTDGSRVMTVSISASTGDVVVLSSSLSGTVGEGEIADGAVTSAKLADSGVTAGTYGDATHVAQVTVNAKGIVTSASDVAISGGGGSVATDTIFDAKGDLAVGTGADTAAKQSVGTNDTVLTADSAQTTGVKWVKVGEGMLALTDVTTGNVSSSTHGFAPKSPADATKFLNGDTTPAFAQVKDSDLSTSDITTNDASTSKHGFLPKLDNDSSHYFDGTGAWSTPAGVGSSGISKGTSFPGSPGTNDIYYRTDRSLLYFYDGTRWLTVNQYSEHPPAADGLIPLTITNVSHRWPDVGSYDVYLEKVEHVTFASNLSAGARYWTVDVIPTSATADLTSLGSFSISGDSNSTWTRHDLTVNAVLDSTLRHIRWSVTKVSTPNGLYLLPRLIYRLVG